MQQYLMPFVNLIVEMAPYLLIGFLFAGLIHGFVPRRFYTRYLAGSDMRSVVNAALMGVPLPLCSCGVIPTAMSLRRNGASKGATVSFLISTPQTGIDSILATASLMGWPMAVIRPVAAFVTGIAGGTLVNRIDKDDAGASAETCIDEQRPKGFKAKMVKSLRYGFVDMIQDIGKWLVIGLVIAGLITILVPDHFFDALQGYPLLNMLVVLAVAMPMYVCATGSIPIAVALIMKGLSPGAALVFLMAGPATNMASILVVNKVLRSKTLLVYLFSIIGGAILFGLGIDLLLPAELLTPKAASACCHHMSEIPVWKIASAVVLLILLVNAFARRNRHGRKHQDNIMETKNADKTIINVKGMVCNHCKANVERVLGSLPDIGTFEVVLETGTVTYTGSARPDDVAKAIEQIGYACSLG